MGFVRTWTANTLLANTDNAQLAVPVLCMRTASLTPHPPHSPQHRLLQLQICAAACCRKGKAA